jgi:hypothetical protein
VGRRCDPWEIGEVLADFATTFGARAPLMWIVYRLFADCVSMRFDDEFDDDMIQLTFSSDHSVIVSVDDWYLDLEQGAAAVLEEWSESESIICHTDHDDLEEWKYAMEGEIEWDEDMFLDRWCDETVS